MFTELELRVPQTRCRFTFHFLRHYRLPLPCRLVDIGEASVGARKTTAQDDTICWDIPVVCVVIGLVCVAFGAIVIQIVLVSLFCVDVALSSVI